MSLRKEHKLAAKSLTRQQQVAQDLQGLLAGIERAEGTITELKGELESVNQMHRNRQTTQEDIDYLTALLRCANKKLGWEKQVVSLRKRAPAIMQDIVEVMQDPKNPPAEAMCATLLSALQQVKAAMERLEQAGVN
jgi:NADH dehydrogenase/NADH:ubiquinone oxidoreductase subunit G